MVPNSVWRPPAWLALTVALALPTAAASTDALNRALELSGATQESSRQSQRRVDTLDDETRRMLDAYRSYLSQADSLRVYNAQMQELVASQQAEIASLEEQIDGIDQTQQGILPLMKRMVDTLERFVALDLPFLPKERNARVASLRHLLTRADVSVSEKYRRILEAYQIENDYGRTLEAYQGRLTAAADAPQVQFLRLGRVALYYLSLDGDNAGVWDAAAGQWRPLEPRYLRVVQRGIRMARQQATPQLLELPLPTAEVNDA